MHLFHLFQKTVDRFPSRVFLRWNRGQRVWTYENIFNEVLEKKRELQHQGLRSGHRLLFTGHNSPHFVVSMLAASATGATFVPLSPDLSIGVRNQIHDLVRPFGSVAAETTPPDPLPSPPPLILFTSGTTATPKGVILTSQNIVSNLDMIARRIPEDVIDCYDHSFAFLPWFHSYGLVCELLFLMTRGASLYLPCSTEPRTFFPEIRLASPSLLFTVPRLLQKTIDAARCKLWFLPSFVQKRLLFGKNLRWISTGGAPCPRSVHDHFKTEWGIPVLQGYGMTEASPMVSLASPIDDSVGSLGPGAANEMAHCGKPLEGVRVIFGPDGRLRIKGPNLSPGYLGSGNVVERPAARFDPDGWFDTGDRCELLEDRLVFRSRDALLYKLANGKFVDPVHMENSLAELPLIQQVAVIQSNDLSIVAVVFPQTLSPPTLETLQNHLRSRGFEQYEMPVRMITRTRPFSTEEGTLTLKQEPNRVNIRNQLLL